MYQKHIKLGVPVYDIKTSKIGRIVDIKNGPNYVSVDFGNECEVRDIRSIEVYLQTGDIVLIKSNTSYQGMIAQVDLVKDQLYVHAKIITSPSARWDFYTTCIMADLELISFGETTNQQLDQETKSSDPIIDVANEHTRFLNVLAKRPLQLYEIITITKENAFNLSKILKSLVESGLVTMVRNTYTLTPIGKLLTDQNTIPDTKVWDDYLYS